MKMAMFAFSSPPTFGGVEVRFYCRGDRRSPWPSPLPLPQAGEGVSEFSKEITKDTKVSDDNTPTFVLFVPFVVKTLSYPVENNLR
jgi:hypothetical protein